MLFCSNNPHKLGVKARVIMFLKKYLLHIKHTMKSLHREKDTEKKKAGVRGRLVRAAVSVVVSALPTGAALFCTKTALVLIDTNAKPKGHSCTRTETKQKHTHMPGDRKIKNTLYACHRPTPVCTETVTRR